MRVVFMGTPQFSVPVFEAILAAGHDVVAVYSRAPAPAGRRNLRVEQTPIHAVAQSRGVRVHTPATFREHRALEAFRELRSDIAVVVAYGLILPRAALDAPLLGCWNLHASLLPRWRGAAPMQRAILAGDEETGACFMRMEVGLDTGPVAGERRTKISAAETSGELSERLAKTGAELVVRSIDALGREGLTASRQPQSGATYAKKIEKSEALIRWTEDANEICKKVNALWPAPGAYALMKIGGIVERVKLARAECVSGGGSVGQLIGEDMAIACGDGAVRVLQAQRAGKTVVSGRQFVAGARLRIGELVGDPTV